MSDLTFYVDLENSAGVRQGPGPITTALQWESTARMDRAGHFRFSMPASDLMAAEVQKRRIARARALVGKIWIEVGAGIIDSIVRRPQADGTVLLDVSGDDLLRELTARSVRDLKLYLNNAPVSHATAVAAVAAYAPAGWTITADPSPPNNLVYGRFNNDTVLAGLIKTAEKSLAHFYRGTGRTVVFASDWTASGVRAIQATGDLAPETCAITGLTVNEETWDLITRIIPRASGNGDLILGLRATTRTASAGYTLNTTQNYIENTAATTTYGLWERVVDFKEIGPISNTTADVQAASDALFDAALEILKRRMEPYVNYDLQLGGCSALLRPMQTLRVVYRDEDAGIDIDADLNILEATWQVDTDGVQTTAVVVTTAQRWAESDAGAIVDSIQQGQIYQALPQINANSYVTAYRANVDHVEYAAFRFRFGAEVTQLQQVLFEFQLLAFESTVKQISSDVPTTSSGGSSVVSSAGGGDHTHTVTVPAHTHGVTVPAHSHTVTVPAHSHTVTVAGHSHTVTIAAHSHTVTIAAHSHTVTVSGHGHTVTISSHTHAVNVYGVTEPSDNPLARIVYVEADNDRLVAATGSGSDNAATTESGGSSTPTSNVTSDATPTSSQQAQSTPTSSELAQTTPSSNTTSQSTPTSSELAQTTPTSSATSDTLVSSASGGSSTPTSTASGTHTHSVTIAAHTHTVSPNITTIYGIFRALAGQTWPINKLEYRINSGAWAALSGTIDVGNGWRRLDMTAVLQHTTTFRPLQESNLLEVRATPALPIFGIVALGGGSIQVAIGNGVTYEQHYLGVGAYVTLSGTAFHNGDYVVTQIIDPTKFVVLSSDPTTEGSGGTCTVRNMVTIDAQLSVRNSIQAILYA